MRIITHCLVVIGLGIGLCGCGPQRQPAPPQTTYLLKIEPDAQTALPTVCFRVRPVSVRTPFSGTGLVYRTGETAYERDFYNQFLVPADQQISDALAEWFAAILCSEETPSDSKRRWTLEPHLEALYGDFRDSASPSAYARLRFVISDYDRSCRCSRILLNEHFEAAADLPRNPSAEEVVNAMSRAVSNTLDQFHAALKELSLPK